MWRQCVGTIVGAPRSVRHECRSHQVETQRTERRMFLLDLQWIVGQSPGPGDLASMWGGGGGGSSKTSESVCLPQSEATTVQKLMDLVLPRFAGLGDGPRQFHRPWMMLQQTLVSMSFALTGTVDGVVVLLTVLFQGLRF